MSPAPAPTRGVQPIVFTMLRFPIFSLILRCALIVACGCLVALVVNAARPDGLPLLPGRVPCPGVPVAWWARLEHVDAAQAHALWQQRAALFVDARSHQDYIFNHLPGALEMPYRDFTRAQREFGDLLKNASLIVIYDAGERPCAEAVRVSKRLAGPRIALLRGGYPAWESAGYPVKGGHDRGEVGMIP